MQREMGAVFGLNNGWEHPLWFAAEDEPTEETAGFARQNWWAPVGREARMLRERAGIIDISTFAKYRAAGPGAQDWLDGLFANRMPRAVGRACLTPLIGARGGVAGDFTVTRLDPDEFLIVGSGIAERFHQRYFRASPPPRGVSFESLTETTCGFNVAGPLARELLQSLTNASMANADFPFMRARRIVISGVDCMALRVSFTGDLGWELHCAAEAQTALYQALLDAGRPLGAGPVGARALNSLRIEKGYGSWGRDYSTEYWPHESGLARLIRDDKPFLNRDAWRAVAEKPARETLTALEIDAEDADASGGEPIFLPDGAPAGQVSSGAYGYTVGKSLALCYLKAGAAAAGDTVHVAVMGRLRPARVLAAPAFDPEGARLRG